MAIRAVSRNNLIAGVFVLLSLVLAIVVSIIISGAQERLIPHREYVLLFALSDGAAGIKAGSEVQVGGQKVGRVTAVAVDTAKMVEGKPGAIVVRVSVRASVPLHKDAVILLERPLLGTMSIINIPDVGRGPALADGDELVARIAPPSFLAQAGYGPQQSRQLQVVLAEAEEMASRLSSIVERIDKRVDPTLDGISRVVTDAGDISGDIKAKLPGWSDDVTTTLDNASAASGKLGPAIDDADAAIADARAAVASVQDAIDDNRPKVDNIVASVESTVTHLEKESLPKVDETLASVGGGAKDFGAAATKLGKLLAEETPTVRKILANLRLAADQAKLAMIEVRSAPWRLLYTPKAKETESENLMSAARSFAEAASDLRAASESLESAAGSDGSPLALDRESIEQMSLEIRKAFDRYQDARKKLLDMLGEQAR